MCTFKYHALALFVFGASAIPVHAGLIYITDFSKNGNIFQNINEEFPNAGTTPNNTFLYDPWNYTPSTTFHPFSETWNGNPCSATNGVCSGYPNQSDNGSRFEIVTDASSHDFEQLTSNGASLTLNVNTPDVTSLYLLVGAYNGMQANIQLNFSGGGNESFNNVSIPDFCNGADQNASTPYSEFTLLRVADQGACATGNSQTGSDANYNMVELAIPVNAPYNGQTLTTATVTSDGYATLVYAATADTSAVPEPTPIVLIGFGLLAVGMLGRASKGRSKKLIANS